LALFFSLAIAAEPAAPRIVVPTVTTYGVNGEIAQVVTELILEALLNRHGVRALGPSDMRDMLDAEQQKMMLGCDKESCMAEIAGAMGAERLIAGSVGMLGSLHVVTLKLVDTKSAQVTSRSSRRFAKIEEVPEAIGPLVDDLLQAAPRARAAALAALGPAEKKENPPAMAVRDFCKRSAAYATQLSESTFNSAAVAERRALLEDLIYTPFLKEFDQKLLCVRQHDSRTWATVTRALKCASERELAMDLKRRAGEWREMVRQVDLLEEAYKTGYEKEKNGVGARPSSLPFPIVERPLEEADNTAEVRRFLDDYLGAAKTLERALQAVKAGDKQAFAAVSAEEDRSRSGLTNMFDKYAGAMKDGYTVDVCPTFIMLARDVEESAERYAKEGVLKGCVRRVRDGWAYSDDVEMKQQPKRGWLIDRF
jgi:hypothetical protein